MTETYPPAGMYVRRKDWPPERVTVRLRHSKFHASDCADCETKEGLPDRMARDIQFVGPITSEQSLSFSILPTNVPSIEP